MRAEKHSLTLRIVLALVFLVGNGTQEFAPKAAAQSISRSDTAKKRNRAKKQSAKRRIRQKAPPPRSLKNKNESLDAARERETGKVTDMSRADDAAAAIPLDQGVQLLQDPEGSEAPRESARYSCPMHQGITGSKPSACPICGMELVSTPGSRSESTAPGSSAEGSPVGEGIPVIESSPVGEGSVEGGVARVPQGMQSQLSFDTKAATPLQGQEMGRFDFLLGGSLSLDLFLGEKLRLFAASYVRLPTEPTVSGSAQHATLSFLLGPFPLIHHFHSPSHDQVLLYPTVTFGLGWRPFTLDFSYTAKGDPAAEITLVWNLPGGFMLHASAGGVMPVSEQSDQVNRTFAVHSMVGVMFARDSTTAELMAHYGHGFHGDATPMGSGGVGESDIHDIHAMHAPMVDLGMLMLEGRHVFFDLIGVGGDLMLMSSTAVGVEGLSWMSQAHFAVDVTPWKLLKLQLAFTASSMGRDVSLPDTFLVSLGVSFAMDFLFGASRH